jgi:hypothetical protein
MIGETPTSKRHMKLRGVFASSQQEQAAALISVNNAAAKFFILGDDILPNLKLLKISPEGVILKSTTGFEKLTFSKSSIWKPIARQKNISARQLHTSPQSPTTLLHNEGIGLRGDNNSSITHPKRNATKQSHTTFHQDLNAQYQALSDIRARLKNQR